VFQIAVTGTFGWEWQATHTVPLNASVNVPAKTGCKVGFEPLHLKQTFYRQRVYSDTQPANGSGGDVDAQNVDVTPYSYWYGDYFKFTDQAAAAIFYIPTQQ
jgi:hypothetical protein